jgi:hypothetical protein
MVQQQRAALNEASDADIPAGCTWLSLENADQAPVDVAKFARRLGAMPAARVVQVLQIGTTSQLPDVRICAAFPALRSLFVHGAEIRSLDGIEHFSGSFLQVDTGRNTKRSLDALARSSIERLLVNRPRPDDLRAAGSCRKLCDLTLAHAAEIDLSLWKALPLAELMLNTCSTRVVAATVSVPPLATLSVRNCRELERFAGDCSNVRVAYIDLAKSTDLASIRALSGVERLELHGARGPLSAILPLRRLRVLELSRSHLEPDVLALRSELAHLEKLHLSLAPVGEVEAISKANPGVVVSNADDDTFRDGRRVAASRS